MTEPTRLLNVATEPRVWTWQTNSAHAAATAMFGWREARLVVRTVRGRKMRRVSDLHDEFAAALQFPWYFGENWDALDECITDLEWLPPEAGYAVVVTDPLLVLDESPEDFEVLVQVLSSTIEEWATPVETGEWWDRPAVPFNVVLAADLGDLEAAADRWHRAGALLTNLR